VSFKGQLFMSDRRKILFLVAVLVQDAHSKVMNRYLVCFNWVRQRKDHALVRLPGEHIDTIGVLVELCCALNSKKGRCAHIKHDVFGTSSRISLLYQ